MPSSETIHLAILVTTFITTSCILFFLSSLLSAFLRSRGWDINDLILIGLEKKDLGDTDMASSPLSFVEIFTSNKNGNLIALALGVFTTVLLMVKFTKSSK